MTPVLGQRYFFCQKNDQLGGVEKLRTSNTYYSMDHFRQILPDT